MDILLLSQYQGETWIEHLFQQTKEHKQDIWLPHGAEHTQKTTNAVVEAWRGCRKPRKEGNDSSSRHLRTICDEGLSGNNIISYHSKFPANFVWNVTYIPDLEDDGAFKACSVAYRKSACQQSSLRTRHYSRPCCNCGEQGHPFHRRESILKWMSMLSCVVA